MGNEQVIFKGSIGGFDWTYVPSDLPNYCAAWSTAPAKRTSPISQWHNSRQLNSTIQSLVVVAAMMYVSEDTYRPGSGVVKVSDSIYAAEYHHRNGEVSYIVYNADNGTVKGSLAQNRTLMREHKRFDIKGSDKANGTALMLALLAGQYDRTEEIKDALVQLRTACDTEPQDDYKKTDALYLLSDALYFGIKDGHIPLTVTTDGNLPKIPKTDIDNGVYYGQTVCGNPQTLSAKMSAKTVVQHDVAFYKASEDVKTYVAQHCSNWSPAEKMMIPTIADDTPVPNEVSHIMTALIGSEDHLRPIRNVLWRGTSGYGKSTGVEILAAILNKPLLRFTCSSTTERQDFLSTIMPDTSGRQQAHCPVSFQQISLDPEGAWELLTGEDGSGKTCEEVFEEAVSRMSENNAGSSTPRYVMQESTFIRALKHGYIVEVQEASRIRDAGVLPGLNEYDRPGALIPLVDGSFARRHRDAFVIYTDNTGYRSCNEYDPAVLRRMAMVIDSYDIEQKDAIARIKRNLSAPSLQEVVSDTALLNKMYKVWETVKTYCEENDLITAGGCVTIEELERWIQLTALFGRSSIRDTCRECLVSKAVTDREEQANIYSLIAGSLEQLED